MNRLLRGEGLASSLPSRSLKFFIQVGRRYYCKHGSMDTGLKPHSVRRPGVLLSDDTPVNNSPSVHTAMTPGGRKIVIPRLPHKTALLSLFSTNQKFISASCAPIPRNPDRRRHSANRKDVLRAEHSVDFCVLGTVETLALLLRRYRCGAVWEGDMGKLSRYVESVRMKLPVWRVEEFRYESDRKILSGYIVENCQLLIIIETKMNM